MAIYIYINDADRDNWKSVVDFEVNELYQEAKQYDKDIIVREAKSQSRRWFRKPKEVVSFSVLFGDRNEARYVNFPPGARSTWTICTDVSKQMVMTYLYGFITGKLKTNQ